MNIYMWSEASDAIIESQAQLNLQTGFISNMAYVPLHDFFNQKENNPPFFSLEYDKTLGSFNIPNKNIEFNIDTYGGSYLLEPEEFKKTHASLKALGINIEDLDKNVEKKVKP